ncbi:unnamed protein product [Adineta ricciae]|uniref:Uncharacterized protein n=1 Tax=Adineta ricciae TaxID=249248 RepID=A0A815A7A4_ADIRI|nr:unnamed protein product [Adineta ricciae]CAF1562170.1 unnamed protein product [Adineta ricciae]
MAKSGGASTCFSISLCVLIFLIIAALAVAIFGTTYYTREKKALSIYKETKCLVTNYTQINKTCVSETCTGSGFLRTCRKNSKPCNLQFYAVQYNITNQTVDTTFTGSGGPGSNSFNHTYTCYYRTTNITKIRWDWPQPRTYLIVLIVGWSCFGVFLIATIGISIFFCLRKNSMSYNQLP